MSNEQLTELMSSVALAVGDARDVPISSPEFPERRIGIRSRFVLDRRLSSRDLAVLAGKRAMARCEISPADLTCVVVSTVTPDCVVPSIASTVHEAVGAPPGIPAMDLTVGCNGFLSALDVGQRFLADAPVGAAALIIGADAMTRVLDASDRTTCAIFGDGGGAVLLQRSTESQMTPIGTATMGGSGPAIQIGPSREVVFRFVADDGRLGLEADRACTRRVEMVGRQVFRDMLRLLPEFIQGYLDRNGQRMADVDAFVFHQANLRMIEAVAARLDIPRTKLLTNIDAVGNTTSASIPILLTEAAANGRLRPGHRVLLVGFGTGYSLGATLLTWSRPATSRR